MWVEILGYIGSAIIIYAICSNDMTTYRIRDSVGCIIFAVYGFLRGTYPAFLISIIILIIHIIFFYKLYIKKRKRKELME